MLDGFPREQGLDTTDLGMVFIKFWEGLWGFTKNDMGFPICSMELDKLWIKVLCVQKKKNPLQS